VGCVRNFAADGVGVGLVAIGGDDTCVEIAIGAFRLAERNLDVDAECHRTTILPHGLCGNRKPQSHSVEDDADWLVVANHYCARCARIR
jgi:hypothetical protein